MSTFVLLLLLFLPLFNTERLQTEFENNDDLQMKRSIASNYLFGLPIRQYQHRLVGSSLLSNDDDNDNDDQLQQRTKRIYWENLAFHASDYDQKARKI